MGPQERAKARRILDRKLDSLRNAEAFPLPAPGWIRAIREALGMTTAQLGRRMGVSQPRAVQVEQAERSGSITLESLSRAARALDCQLVYALIPHDSLEAQVRNRALMLARERLRPISHSMALEGQRVTEEDERDQLESMVDTLLSGPGSKLWDEP